MPIELYKREIDTRLFLAGLAVNKGYDVLIGFHRDKIFKSAQNAVVFYKGHGLGNRSVREQWKTNKNFVTALDEEGLIRGAGDSLYSRERLDPDGYDRVFAWGDDQASLMSHAGMSNLTISGSPKFDITRLLKRKAYTQSSEKLQVCINTRFGQINPYTGDGVNPLDKFQEGISKLCNNTDVYFEKETKIFSEFIKLIEYLKNSSNIDVVIRPHPVENKKVYEVLIRNTHNMSVDNNSPLFKVISDSDIIVHDACTTALEAKSAGKIVFTLRPGGLGSHYVDLANNFSDYVYESAHDLYKFITNSTAEDIRKCRRELDNHITHFIANWNGAYFFEHFFDAIQDRGRNAAVRYDVTDRLEAYVPSSDRYKELIFRNLRGAVIPTADEKFIETDATRKVFNKSRAKKKFPNGIRAREICKRLTLLEKALNHDFDITGIKVTKISRRAVIISKKIRKCLQ
jgi:surface carbohydrate biosynthesis protein